MQYRTIGSMLLLAVVALGCRNATAPAQRPTDWGQPVSRVGLPNLHRVSPTLYRAAQPSAQGLAAFEKMGGRSVVNFRQEDSDGSLIGETDLQYAWHPVNAVAVDFDDVKWFLTYATNPANQPVLVHCKHGADRTGVMIAAYRVVIQGWAKEAAIDEMTSGGFNYHRVFVNLPGLIREMDIDQIRQAIGLARPTEQPGTASLARPSPQRPLIRSLTNRSALRRIGGQ